MIITLNGISYKINLCDANPLHRNKCPKPLEIPITTGYVLISLYVCVCSYACTKYLSVFYHDFTTTRANSLCMAYPSSFFRIIT